MILINVNIFLIKIAATSLKHAVCNYAGEKHVVNDCLTPFLTRINYVDLTYDEKFTGSLTSACQSYENYKTCIDGRYITCRWVY